jgi:hypothetical protein
LDLSDLADKLRTIEEDLRDRAYDALRNAAEGDDDAAAAEKRILQARRAVERAIRALDPEGGWSEGP